MEGGDEVNATGVGATGVGSNGVEIEVVVEGGVPAGLEHGDKQEESKWCVTAFESGGNERGCEREWETNSDRPESFTKPGCEEAEASISY